MLKKDYWLEKGYTNNYVDIIMKGISAFLRETKLRKEDLEGLLLLIGLRNRLRPDLNLKEFIQALLNTFDAKAGNCVRRKGFKGLSQVL